MRSFTAEPNEIDLMQEAYDAFCSQNDITSKVDRASIALQVTSRYAEGARTVKDLYAGLRMPGHRKPTTHDKLLLVSTSRDSALDTDQLIQLQNFGLITLTCSGWVLTSAGRVALGSGEA